MEHLQTLEKVLCDSPETMCFKRCVIHAEGEQSPVLVSLALFILQGGVWYSSKYLFVTDFMQQPPGIAHNLLRNTLFPLVDLGLHNRTNEHCPVCDYR